MDYKPSATFDNLRARARELFGVSADGHDTGPAHCSLVYDNIGSKMTDGHTALQILGTHFPERKPAGLCFTNVTKIYLLEMCRPLKSTLTCLYVDYKPSATLDKLRARARDQFRVSAEGHDPSPAHCSLVYDINDSKITDKHMALQILDTLFTCGEAGRPMSLSVFDLDPCSC